MNTFYYSTGKPTEDQVPRSRFKDEATGLTVPDPPVSAWLRGNEKHCPLKKGPNAPIQDRTSSAFRDQEVPCTHFAGHRRRASQNARRYEEPGSCTVRSPRTNTPSAAADLLADDGARSLALSRTGDHLGQDPRVSTSTLRKALAEVVAAEALCPPNADTYKAEYIDQFAHLNDQEYLKRTLLTADGYRRPSGTGYYEAYWYRNLPWYEEARDFLNHERERSRRVARLVFTQWIAHADGVRPFRTTFTDRYPDLSEPAAKRCLRLILPAGLNDWYHSHDSVTRPSSSIGTTGVRWERAILSQGIVACESCIARTR